MSKKERKLAKEAAEADSDDEESTSAVESEKESSDDKKGQKKDQKKAKDDDTKNKKSKNQKQKQSEEEREEKEEVAGKQNKGKKDTGKSKESNASKKKAQEEGQKKGNYPEAVPMPHPRRPNYIEPVRAEVVQTERVMETPEDPPPNAYYDAEHNIIRVYHGPVWGGNPNQSLYPRRDASQRPMPLGMPHPTQNPYFYGFNDQAQPPPHGYQNVPITQGMPVNAWNAMMPPHPAAGYLPGQPEPEVRSNKGAFSQMTGANGKGPPSSKDKDKAGGNNVAPGSIKVSSTSGMRLFS